MFRSGLMTQKALAELFGVQVPGIDKHLKYIFDSGELAREATVSKMEIVRAEGDRKVARDMKFYNLDAINAVGHRVNSFQATQFRNWATKTLREFVIKGFVLDDDLPASSVEGVHHRAIWKRTEGAWHGELVREDQGDYPTRLEME